MQKSKSLGSNSATPCVVHDLVIKGTVSSQVLEVLKGKKALLKV